MNLTKQLHGLTDQKLALIVSQLEGTADESVGILEVEDLGRPVCLQMVWQVLDQAHGTLAHERMEEA